jgi:hypothetical protein
VKASSSAARATLPPTVPVTGHSPGVWAVGGGVEDGVGDGGGYANHRDLAEALDADGVVEEVGLVDEVNIGLLDVGVHRDLVFLQRVVKEAAEPRVDLAFCLGRACLS